MKCRAGWVRSSPPISRLLRPTQSPQPEYVDNVRQSRRFVKPLFLGRPTSRSALLKARRLRWPSTDPTGPLGRDPHGTRLWSGGAYGLTPMPAFAAPEDLHCRPASTIPSHVRQAGVRVATGFGSLQEWTVL
jgi:hypothetical protein